MNNLLRTLTESKVKSASPNSDLKLLLTTVKEGRRQSYDSKLSDQFYDSLEGLLVDLKTITIDNRDAEAFLKPVSKSEVPDYYDVISNPMDFQTMLKKVKQKQYKSKREFKDDLDLIWSNCFTYNATENHPLRQCVKRLKVKADYLLKHITDRKERTDPLIPGELTNNIPRPKVNGQVNGRAHSRSLSANNHRRSPSFSGISKASTPTNNQKATSLFPAKKTQRRDVPFPDTTAITRTPQGMSLFSQLDWEISQGAGPSRLPSGFQKDTQSPLVERLQQLSPLVQLDDEPELESVRTSDDNAMLIDDVVGGKRRLNGFTDHRPSKRARFSSQHATPVSFEGDELSELWWGAVQSDTLLANGLPHIPYPSSSSISPSINLPQTKHPGPISKPRLKPKRRKKGSGLPRTEQSSTLLAMMNNNIKTMKRVRHTHAKFAALNMNLGAGGGDEDGAGAEGGVGMVSGIGTGYGGAGMVLGSNPQDEDGIEAVDDKVDEQPWGARIKRKGSRRLKGIEIGENNATDCVQWMGAKVLEHAGFQGSSQSALDVLTGVTTEYLFNVGRTIRFLCDKHSSNMTPEEIILHTLFESGTSKVQDLERYITDDVQRHGSRLVDLEKKLVTAYRDATAVEVLEDEGLFEDDEEDAGVLAIGDFADALGEDYLGLRELGIAAEFGMSSLSIPKKLLRGKKTQSKLSSADAKPSEPPPPYPPPPPFISLASNKVEDQIGLLMPYYQSRFAALAALSAPPPPSLPGPSLPGPFPGPRTEPASVPLTLVPSHPSIPPISETGTEPKSATSPILILPDDQPSVSQVKMGPLGQIVKGGTAGGASKKKKAGPVAGTGGGGGLGTELGVPSSAKKKKTGMVGVGTGNGRKKKLLDVEGPVPGHPLPVLTVPSVPQPVMAAPLPPVAASL